jgi:hypothetical protein
MFPVVRGTHFKPGNQRPEASFSSRLAVERLVTQFTNLQINESILSRSAGSFPGIVRIKLDCAVGNQVTTFLSPTPSFVRTGFPSSRLIRMARSAVT